MVKTVRVHVVEVTRTGVDEPTCSRCWRPSWKTDLCLLHHQEHLAFTKKRRETAMKKGLCGVCRKRKPTKGYTTCRRCRQYLKEISARYNARHGKKGK